MGATQSQQGGVEEEDAFHDALDGGTGTAAVAVAGRKGTVDAGDGSGPSGKPQGAKLYRYSGGRGPTAKWTLFQKDVQWKFAQLGNSGEDDEEDEEDEEEGGSSWRSRKEQEDKGKPEDWYLVVGTAVQALVGPQLNLRFNDDALRTDFIAVGVWTIKFSSAEEYRAFAAQFKDCLFENTHHLQATEKNWVKVIGKDAMAWKDGEDKEGTMWDAEEGGSEDEEKSSFASNFRETFRQTPGKGAQSLAMGALQNSYLLHAGGVDVYKNQREGIMGEGLSFSIKEPSGSPYNTPKKGMLMRAETNMMLMSPANAGTPHAEGLAQMDIDTGKIVSRWQFEKDGTPITMRDITADNKSAQLDSSQATFLGLDDNRLCRWDMRDKAGMVQQLASPTLNWTDGHQFARGTNFQCFASTGDGSVAVGSRDGKVRLYSTKSMGQAKTAFPGLGSPITHIDVTFDGKWVLATTDTYLIVISTLFRDKDGREKSGFSGRMGGNMAAPRLLKITPEDAYVAGKDFKFQNAQFSWVRECLLAVGGIKCGALDTINQRHIS